MKEIKRILAATDFDADGNAAVDYACTLAERLGAELHLLHIVPQSLFPSRATAEAERFQAAHQGLGKLPSRMTRSTLMILRKTCEGVPADEILRYAEENSIDLIALGTHGRNGLAHFVVGSVAEKFIRAAPCPVVIVRQSMTQLLEGPDAGDESTSSAEVTAVRSLGQAEESNRVLELLERALAVRATQRQ